MFYSDGEGFFGHVFRWFFGVNARVNAWSLTLTAFNCLNIPYRPPGFALGSPVSSLNTLNAVQEVFLRLGQ